MPATNDEELIERIHASGNRLVLAITGGGSGAIASLLEVSGGSASVLEAIVPYAATALEKWLGGPVDQHCSERTARAMAMAAFERSRQLSGDDPQRLRGIGATASLVTTRPKRGPHRVHVAWQSAEATVTISCELEKGRRDRAEEEAIATQLILTAVAEACGLEARPLVDANVHAQLQRREQRAPKSWRQLLLGERDVVKLPESAAASDSETPAVLFPGAFNPLHSGHERMAEVAEARYGRPVTFELSIANVDKPPLDYIELADRLDQLIGRQVLLTRAPTFADKALVAPGCVFVVGIDTLMRIADPRYYGGEVAHRDTAIATIARQGCRFLVFGRALQDRFVTLVDVDLPADLRTLCDEVPESAFRDDICSTELRNV